MADLTRRRDIGAPLSANQFDANIDNLDERLIDLEENPPEAVEIDEITLVGQTMVITMSDTTSYTLDLPLRHYTPIVWAPGATLTIDQVFPINGTLYSVIFDHVAEATFDPGANDGSGNDYYFALLPNPGNSLPEGGELGQVLMKLSDSNYDVGFRNVPAQYIVFDPDTDSTLTGIDNVNDAINELDSRIASGDGIDASQVVFNPTTDSALSSETVGAALEELEGLIGTGGGVNAADVAFTPTTDSSLSATDVSAALEELEGMVGGGAYLPLAGGTMLGAIELAADPASAMQPTTKQYVDGLALNLGKRARVRAATTANITIATALNNADTLDGVTLATGDLVLVKNQSAPEENGVYVVGASPGRFAEFDTYNEHPGSLIVVAEGSTNADTIWLCTSNAGGTLNTTAIAFTQVTATGALLASNNLSDLANAATARSNIGLSAGAILAVIDGAGSAITTGLKGYLGPMPFGGTINQATLLADQTGSIVVDVWKCTYAQFDAGSTHPVSGDKITASAPPTITTDVKSQDSTLTGWTTAFSAGDILAFNVNSVTDIERVTLELKIAK